MTAITPKTVTRTQVLRSALPATEKPAPKAPARSRLLTVLLRALAAFAA